MPKIKINTKKLKLMLILIAFTGGLSLLISGQDIISLPVFDQYKIEFMSVFFLWVIAASFYLTENWTAL